MGRWAELAETLNRRDNEQIENIYGSCGGGPTLENRLELANGRALDALIALHKVLLYLDEIETRMAKEMK
jgi:hypothetical protein